MTESPIPLQPVESLDNLEQSLAPTVEVSPHPRYSSRSPALVYSPSKPQVMDDRAFPSTKSVPQPIANPIAYSSAYTNVRQSPSTGGQLYRQRLAALNIGRIYTRLPSNSFETVWRHANLQPTYEQWRKLLALESRAVARRRSGTVSVMLGDSLSLWFPTERLPQSSIWLNQGISGETTGGMLARSGDLGVSRPGTIYIMAGVNDLKRGLSDREILQNLQRFCQRYAGIPIVIQSILPTRSAKIPNDRIARLNRWIEQLADQQGAYYLNIHQSLVASDGYIRAEYTTDGIHLSDRGYAVWQQALMQSESIIAQGIDPRSFNRSPIAAR